LGAAVNPAPVVAGNPVLQQGGSADPSALVVGDTMWLYPTRDHRPGMDKFRMECYRSYSSQDLINWTDHGVFLDGATDISWCRNPHNHHAATMITHGGKYWFYFFFPNNAPEKGGVRGTEIGVAVGATPAGPFRDALGRPLVEPGYVPTVHNATPMPLVDKDGKIYLFWGNSGTCLVEPMDGPANLGKPDFRNLNPPPPSFSEGIWVFRRGDRYYFTYSAGSGFNPLGVYYGRADAPMGPYQWQGVLMNGHNRQTHHHSIVEFHGQWYMFYHWDNVHGLDRKFRQTAIEHLFFNADGTIALCIPTLAGVGPFPADRWIEAVKFAQGNGVNIVDGAGTAETWDDAWNDVPWIAGRRGAVVENARLSTRKELVERRRWKVASVDGSVAPARLIYRGVIFGTRGPDVMELRVASPTGARLRLRADSADAAFIGEVIVPATGGADKWTTVTLPLTVPQSGVHPIYLEISGGRILIDRYRFVGCGTVTFPLPVQRSVPGLERLEAELADAIVGGTIHDEYLLVADKAVTVCTFNHLSFPKPATAVRIRHLGEAKGTRVEIRLKSADGALLADAALPPSAKLILTEIPVTNHRAGDEQTLCLVVRPTEPGGKRHKTMIDWIDLDPGPAGPVHRRP
jgi:hypothetical protein